MPYIDHGAGHRLAVNVTHLPIHEQDFALLDAVIESCLALGQRSSGDVEWAFYRSRCATFDTGLALSLIHAEIEKRLDTEPRHQKPVSFA